LEDLKLISDCDGKLLSYTGMTQGLMS